MAEVTLTGDEEGAKINGQDKSEEEDKEAEKSQAVVSGILQEIVTNVSKRK